MTQQTPLEAAEAASRAVAAEVRAEMARQRRSNADLAAMLGITAHTAGRKANGSISFTVRELARVAAWLGVTVAVFATRAEAALAVAA